MKVWYVVCIGESTTSYSGILLWLDASPCCSRTGLGPSRRKWRIAGSASQGAGGESRNQEAREFQAARAGRGQARGIECACFGYDFFSGIAMCVWFKLHVQGEVKHDLRDSKIPHGQVVMGGASAVRNARAIAESRGVITHDHSPGIPFVRAHASRSRAPWS